MSAFAEQASAAIRQSGGRMTAQRQIIITLLEHSDEEVDAELLYQRVREKDPSVSIATVYRTLNVLEEAGLIEPRYRTRDHERRYFEPLSGEKSYYFTCRVCRKVIPFKTDLVHQLQERVSDELGFDVMHACVCLDGICPDCQEKQQHDA